MVAVVVAGVDEGRCALGVAAAVRRGAADGVPIRCAVALSGGGDAAQAHVTGGILGPDRCHEA